MRSGQISLDSSSPSQAQSSSPYIYSAWSMRSAPYLAAAFFFLIIFKATGFNALETALANQNSLSPSERDDPVILVTLDGSMSLQSHNDSDVILWTYESGIPIYSSYQAPRIVDTYIDVGFDGKLYIHDKTTGISQRLGTNVRDLVTATPISVNGTTIIGQMTTAVSILDAKTGALLQTFSPSPLALGFEGENPVVLGGAVKRLEGLSNSIQEADELVYITRTDYAFMAYSESRSVLWKFMYSDITAKLSSTSGIYCPGGIFSSQDSGLKVDMPTSCQRNVIIKRKLDLISLVGRVDHMPYSLEGSVELVGYPAEPADGHRDSPPGGYNRGVLSIAPESIPALPPSPDHTFVSQDRLRNIFLIIVGCICLCSLCIALIKPDKEIALKPSTAKKKKTRKSGISKNSNQMSNLKGNESGAGNGGTSGAFADSQMCFSGLIDGNADGRQIGKLYLSSKEIARGSNGTVVFEGVYDGRLVAVKRLVQTHHDVALKEIQNLIASDQHPNIVRWYGMEFDLDFVYLSLERCTCNLNDLICCYSQPPKSATAPQEDSLRSSMEYTVQLQQSIGSTAGFELWRANGYPSAQLLKLMRDVVSGLAHLHEIGIIHRDLKPHNILIIKEKTLCAKLSDMGISKRIDGDTTSLSQHATGIGSSGWRAPEQLKNGRQTCAMDLFSLGCVLFFCITSGRHPYGDTYERDANIVNDQKDLFLVDSIPEALDLISQLLDPSPELRPKAWEVLHHPLFWNCDTRLSFLRDVSDRVELEDREADSELLKALESVGSEALGGKWNEKMDNSILDNIGRYRRYKYDSVRDLLRVVRNKLNHYRELPKGIQEALGSVPEGFDFYFTSRFPRLLMEVYKVIFSYCAEEELLSKYFKSTHI